MFELLNETLFEKHMAEYLAGSKMYNPTHTKGFQYSKVGGLRYAFTILTRATYMAETY